jgi:hypothetical protein
MPDTPEQLLQALENESEAICGEITNLLAGRAQYKNVMGMVDKNPEIQRPSFFYSWLRAQYSTAQCLGVRRLVDGDPRTLSLRNLLSNLWRVAHLVTADRHARMYEAKDIGGDTGRGDFQKFAAADGASLNLAMVSADLETLRTSARAIKDFVDRRVAHTQKVTSKQEKLPTFGQLDGCLDLLETLALKYRELLIGVSGHLTPVIDDFEGIFRVAWAPLERF